MSNVNWMTKAKCSGRNDIEFFPEKGYSGSEAKEFCGDCPVKVQCLNYAVKHNLRDGFWGGTSPMERRSIRRLRRTTG